MKYFVLIVGLVFSSVSYAKDNHLEKSIVKAANRVGVPVEILRAICTAESNLNRRAYVFHDGGEENHAFGACQVLLTTAKAFGFKDKDGGCKGDFRYRRADRHYKSCGLFGPYTNAFYAAKVLKRQLKRYGGSTINAIAAYNTGSVKMCRSGWVRNKKRQRLYRCQIGGILNQKYVDRVLEALQRHAREQNHIENQGFRP